MTQPFGELPPAPRPLEESGGSTLPADAPPSIVTAVRLMLLRSTIGVVSLIALFATKDDLKQRILDKSPDASDSAVNTTLTVSAGFGLVVLIFYVFLAVQVRRGANWARIVTWVIAGLGILGTLVGFDQPDPPLSRVLAIVVGVIDVAVVILLARDDSNRFFRTRT